MNEIMIKGNLAKEVEIGISSINKLFKARCVLADNDTTPTTYFSIVGYTHIAKVMEQLSTGDFIFVKGKMSAYHYKNKNGEDRRKDYVHVYSLKVLRSKSMEAEVTDPGLFPDADVAT